MAASNFLISIWVPPNFRTDSLINLAASASAYDLIICAFFNYSSLRTTNFCFSANCCCTALLSTAFEYSRLKPKCIKLTSATFTLKSRALEYSCDLIYLLIVSLFLSNWSASSIYWFSCTLCYNCSEDFLTNGIKNFMIIVSTH